MLNKNNIEVAKKVFLSIFAISIFYCNFWIMLARSPASELAQKLPISRVAADLFDTFSVFSYYETINRNIVIRGLPKNSPSNHQYASSNEWVNIDLSFDYFPHCLGEQQMRLYFSKHLSLGQEEFNKACKAMANKIKTRVNLKRPNNQLHKISIGVEIWPRSLLGYEYLKEAETTKFTILCVGD
ncbi:MAG: hypothetical protein QNJ31_01935 [Candidatus Caenarcaniphilales bacterium]|nr:hypothetical protein [Candidatus Caenarcaniphilales bacterium]